MEKVSWNIIDGRGKLIKVTIEGKPKTNCYACSITLGGAAFGCVQHGVTRTEENYEKGGRRNEKLEMR